MLIPATEERYRCDAGKGRGKCAERVFRYFVSVGIADGTEEPTKEFVDSCPDHEAELFSLVGAAVAKFKATKRQPRKTKP